MAEQETYYLDYNSTAPLCLSVREKISKQLYPDGNPSSIHSDGKRALKMINKITRRLFDTFSLSSHDFFILYHSGATEGVNTILRNRDCVFYTPCDHPCVTKFLASQKKAKHMDVNAKGKIENLKQMIDQFKISNDVSDLWINITWMNNETGVVEDIFEVIKLKKEFGFKIHVDAVQTVGKIPGWNKLSSDVDAYTYSGHKFGALKGIGFSFVKNNVEIRPLLLGGSQQRNLRSGTLNSHGIFSLMDALLELDCAANENLAMLQLKNEIIQLIKSFSMTVIENDSYNTICFIHPHLKSDELLIHFDLHGLCVSSGSACSSGSLEPSKVLEAMAFGELARNSIRISLGRENLQQAQKIKERLNVVLTKIDQQC